MRCPARERLDPVVDEVVQRDPVDPADARVAPSRHRVDHATEDPRRVPERTDDLGAAQQDARVERHRFFEHREHDDSPAERRDHRCDGERGRRAGALQHGIGSAAPGPREELGDDVDRAGIDRVRSRRAARSTPAASATARPRRCRPPRRRRSGARGTRRCRSGPRRRRSPGPPGSTRDRSTPLNATDIGSTRAPWTSERFWGSTCDPVRGHRRRTRTGHRPARSGRSTR